MILLKKLLIPLILFGLIFFALFAYTFFYYSKNLPNIDEITEYKPKTITKIYDSNDLLYGLELKKKLNRNNVLLACLVGSFTYDKQSSAPSLLCQKCIFDAKIAPAASRPETPYKHCRIL